MANGWKNFWNPFTKIAGGKALLIGVAGLAVSVVCAIVGGWHANGLLHFGPVRWNEWWMQPVEYLVIWLVPATIFYGLGAALSRSRVRAIDIFGTAAFALLPLVVMNLWHAIPGVGDVWDGLFTGATGQETVVAFSGMMIDSLMDIMAQPLFWVDVIISVAVLALMLVWLFNAVKVSCNLKGWRLWTVYLAGVLIGDAICRQVMMAMYMYLHNH